MAKPRRNKQPSAPRSRGIAPVLLAAGASRRLGECKALVDLEGRTPLERLMDGARPMAQKINLPTLVLVGPDHAQAIDAQRPADTELLLNPNAHLGRTGGLILAVEERKGFDLMIVPVDVPRVPARVFEQLVAAWIAQGSPPMGWLAPRFEGRFGHPVLIGHELAARLVRFGPDRPLSDLRSKADPLLSLETDCRETLEDLDTPGDLAGLRQLMADKKTPSEQEFK
jgi:molybdenum cofactor cytidylyltransferase